ncbi:hypothetical protein MMC10_006229 [Thelotrema lepadinum]|nr:hypothetical protein [Thelotrema lepadinum]
MIILATLVIVQSIFLLRAFQVAGRAWPVPDFKTDTITFGRRIEWEFSPQAEDLWNGAVSGSGLVAIKNPEQYGLVNGLNTSVASSRVYGITVTHEYHCLQLIHKSLIGIATRNATYMEEIHATNTSVELPNGKLNHLFHCVDYLRQNIMCKADTTLEWNTVADSEHIDGYGIPHQCRNWQEVSGWMRENLPPEKEYQEMQQID